MPLLSRVSYTGNGSTQNFALTFPYIERTHVQVRINGVQLETWRFQWLDDATIRIAGAPVDGSKVEIRRATPRDAPLVTFQNGAVLTEEELNLAKLQQFYIAQELVDSYEALIEGELTRLSGLDTTPEEMIAGITEQILNSTLANLLQQRIEDIDLNAESILEQTLRLDGIDARIVNVETTVVNEYEALAQTVALMGAQNEDGSAFILDQNTVHVTPGQSLAASISTLQSSVGDNTASLQTHASVLDGLTAQYMVKTDVNGNVSGFGLYNDGATSDFIVLADRFAIIDPNAPTGSPKVPFSVSGGVVYMENVVIRDALIQNMTVSKLTQGNLNADINVGTGRITWSNGTYMKVAGVGFGTSNQFIEWFGPQMSISACSEANAIYYLKTNGSAYFGGTLSAGVITNSSRTTVIGATEFELGPFGSNGDPISVTATYQRSWRRNYTSDPISCSSPSVSWVVERKIGTGAWVQIGSRTTNGTGTVIDFGAGSWRAEASLGDSITVSTTPGAHSDVYVRIRTTSLTPPVVGSGSAPSTYATTLGLVTVEQ